MSSDYTKGESAAKLSRSALYDLKKALLSGAKPKRIAEIKLKKRKKLGSKADEGLGIDTK